MSEPRVIKKTSDYLALYKGENMHCAPLNAGESGTLLAWCAEKYPEVLGVRGRKSIEGGLCHRLDYQTRGLVLVARTQAFFDAVQEAQAAGLFLKTYEACGSRREGPPLPGFPPPPESGQRYITSAFRPFGPGRKAVRPIPGSTYRTEILNVTGLDTTGSRALFTLRLARGHRHQCRAHLAWLGWPILNDDLYGGPLDGGPLALHAAALSLPGILIEDTPPQLHELSPGAAAPSPA